MTKQHAGRRAASTPRGIAPKADRTKSLRAHTHTHTRMLACTHNCWVAPLLHAEPLQPHVHACITAQQMHRDAVSVHMAHVQPQLVLLQSWHGQVHKVKAQTCSWHAHVWLQHTHAIPACKCNQSMQKQHPCTCNCSTHVQSHPHARAITSPRTHSITAPTNVQSQPPGSPHAVQSHAHPYPHTSTLLGHPPPSFPSLPPLAHTITRHTGIFLLQLSGT